ncbi:MAG: hypothetical protein DKINENOH_01273 [bacterium]|nr:hypothetical protein [bacterium]MCK6562059.1 hypothetical protein [bacterium]NUM64338.1 hypothetical protein [candidate division KSB1 bacterium]
MKAIRFKREDAVTIFTFFLSLALLAAAIHVVFSMLIVGELQRRKVKINFFLLRLYLPKYAQQYKQASLQETGKVGGLYHGWLVSINAAWILAVIGFVLR